MIWLVQVPPRCSFQGGVGKGGGRQNIHRTVNAVVIVYFKIYLWEVDMYIGCSVVYVA